MTKRSSTYLAGQMHRDENGRVVDASGQTPSPGAIRRFERREQGGGIPGAYNKFQQWNKVSGGPAIATGPNAQEIYGGPQAFGAYRPEAAGAQGSAEGMAAAQRSLTGLQGLAQTGWTDTGRQQYEMMLRRQQQAGASQRQGALQQAQARGLSRGGAGLLAGLVGSQSDANAAADSAAQMAAQGENNRMAASQAAGTMALGINDQTFAQEAARRGATDAFNQWAAGMQANAAQQAYQNQQAQYEQQRHQYEYGRSHRGGKMGDFFRSLK